LFHLAHRKLVHLAHKPNSRIIKESIQ
jgi:hypothetical protein